MITNEMIKLDMEMDAPFNHLAETIYRSAGKEFHILDDTDVRKILKVSNNISINRVSLTLLGIENPIASYILLYRQLMN